GTFLVEDGKVTRGIKNMRFNQGVIEMLNNVSALSPVDPSFMVPAMKVTGFHFSSKTRF
ncbi:TldD/PmbA family protein, partial [bacterium]|nr:TldD/PmbA family protein [bacterium]